MQAVARIALCLAGQEQPSTQVWADVAGGEQTAPLPYSYWHHEFTWPSHKAGQFCSSGTGAW